MYACMGVCTCAEYPQAQIQTCVSWIFVGRSKKSSKFLFVFEIGYRF